MSTNVDFVEFSTPAGQSVSSRAYLAASFKARLTGLLNRASLGMDEGLLLQPGGSIHTFGMRFPIDVLFLDADNSVLRTCSHIRPWRAVRAPRGTRSVLELAAGRIQQVAISEGMRLVLTRPAPL